VSTVGCGTVHILVIEDETKLAAAISQGLQAEGYAIAAAHSGEAGLKLLRENQFDLLLLAVMLPRKGGIETLRDLRRDGFKMPVLILTSRDSIDDRVLGLDAGADDYLVKPYAFPELLARVRALLRRNRPESASKLHLADLVIDVNQRTAGRSGKALDLTSREFDLLEYFLLNRGNVISREMLARDVWREPLRYTSLDNVIDVQIARLRRKVDDPFPRKILHTVRGVGFVLREEDA
jgi:two-component system, OmpR family, copper resistance phosphate regulon response regulator CusR